MSDMITIFVEGGEYVDKAAYIKQRERIERLTAALDAVKGFCKYCGATYPHRNGEGRCERCAGAAPQGAE